MFHDRIMDTANDAIELLSHQAMHTLQPSPPRGCRLQCDLLMTVCTVACALCGVLHIGAHVELQARRAFLQVCRLEGHTEEHVLRAPWWVGATWVLVPLLCVLMR